MNRQIVGRSTGRNARSVAMKVIKVGNPGTDMRAKTIAATIAAGAASFLLAG